MTRRIPGFEVERVARASRRRASLFVLLTALGLSVAGCGDDPVQPQPALSPEARAHLEEVIDIMEAHALHRLTIDWVQFRERTLAAAADAQTIPQTYGAIVSALGRLGDRGHSRYITPQGGSLQVPFVQTGLDCRASPMAPPQLSEEIGYVRVGSFTSAQPGAPQAFAQAIQDSIRARDRQGLLGWIVDLRGNTGGNMWPMLAGLGPVLGEGEVGHFIGPAGERVSTWGYSGDASTVDGEEVVRVSAPYRLVTPQPRVAVLVDGLVASSGEAMVLAFRNRPDSRSFGSRTCGLATGVRGFLLSDGALLALTGVWMADRTGATFAAEIHPDEAVGDQLAVQRAVEWLRSAR